MAKARGEKQQKVRVRFAPSPTGQLHVGGARTALINYLFAKKHKGAFVLRIEDTDVQRGKDAYLKKQLQDLKWLGLSWDEGIQLADNNVSARNNPVIKDKSQEMDVSHIVGNDSIFLEKGNCGPYRQSQRLSVYREQAEKLITENKAYYCFLNETEIQNQKQEAIKNNQPPRVQSPYREWSLQRAKEKINKGACPVIRFKNSVEKKIYAFKDIVRGDVQFPSDMVGDFILMRSSGLPVYNFACAIDDYKMQITHVFRSEEHLANTLRQLMIFESFNWPLPQFGHLSIIQGEDRKKLSKRHGAASVSEYGQQGILSSALINFLALLGWNPKTTQEMFSLCELIEHFSTEGLNSAAAVFDSKKLEWMNSQHLKKLSAMELWKQLDVFFKAEGLKLPESTTWRKQAVETLRSSFSNLCAAVECFRLLSLEHFTVHPSADEVFQWPTTSTVFQMWEQALMAHSQAELTSDDFAQICSSIQKQVQVKGKFLFMPLRVAIIGRPQGAELKQIIPLISRSVLLQRVKKLLQYQKVK